MHIKIESSFFLMIYIFDSKPSYELRSEYVNFALEKIKVDTKIARILK